MRIFNTFHLVHRHSKIERVLREAHLGVVLCNQGALIHNDKTSNWITIVIPRT